MRSPLLLLALCCSCASPLALRDAQVLDPGEFELTAGVDTYINRLGKLSPATTVNGRAGVGAGLDLQLKLRGITADLIDVETNVGVELVARDELDITLVTGVGYYGTLGLLPAFGGTTTLLETGAIDVPFVFLIDAKSADERHRLSLGLRLAPSVAWNLSDAPPVALFPVDLRMGASLGYTTRWGPLVVRPEIGLDTTAIALLLGAPWVNPQAGLQVGMRF